MGLFDMIKEKAGELLSGAGDKVAEVTGAELPGADVAEQVTGNLTETTQGLTDTATGAVDGVSGTATDAIGDITNPLK